MFSPPFFPGAGYLSPFGCLPRTHRRFAKRNRKVFQKSFEKRKMRPPAERGQAQRKCKQYLDDLTVHIRSQNSPIAEIDFF